MVDENKIKLMTRIAVYEKNEEDDHLVMSKYYKRDYVRFNLLKSVVAASFAFWMMAAIYVFLNFEKLLVGMDNIDYFDLVYNALLAYFVFAALYGVIAAFLYSYRYEKAKPDLFEYNGNLKDLIEFEGGPIQDAKLVDEDDDVVEIVARADNTDHNRAVSRTELIKRRELEQEEQRREQIIQNARLREERIHKEKEEQLRQENERQKRIQQMKELERIKMEQKKRDMLNGINNMNNNQGGNE